MQTQSSPDDQTEATKADFKEYVTHRGFPRIEFSDFYNERCSLQLSSLADTPAIWLGVDSPEVKILQDGNWQPVTLPDGAQLSGRMHLSHQQVEKLLPYLMAFVETGDLLGKTTLNRPEPQFLAEIKKTSKYAYQINWMRSSTVHTYPFRCAIDSDDGGEYVVKGGVGGQYRLSDVNLYVVADGRKIRLK